MACLGLVKAVDRFDPERGHAFMSYAVPTIDGELKRHLRDHTWGVHVPRRIQDKHRRVRLAQEELGRAGRPHGDSTHDLHRLTGIDEQDVRLALCADRARNPVSIDEQRGPTASMSLADTMGADDPALDHITDVLSLHSLITRLPDRERRVLKLYFLDALTQREVAAIVGVSQMQVSRLLNRSCAFLRSGMTQC